MTEKITAADAIRLLDSGKAVAVDVREPDEYAVGHIPGAKLLPLGQVIDRAAEVLPDKNALWLVYCRTGRRSADAVQKLFNKVKAPAADAATALIIMENPPSTDGMKK